MEFPCTRTFREILTSNNCTLYSTPVTDSYSRRSRQRSLWVKTSKIQDLSAQRVGVGIGILQHSVVARSDQAFEPASGRKLFEELGKDIITGGSSGGGSQTGVRSLVPGNKGCDENGKEELHRVVVVFLSGRVSSPDHPVPPKSCERTECSSRWR